MRTSGTSFILEPQLIQRSVISFRSQSYIWSPARVFFLLVSSLFDEERGKQNKLKCTLWQFGLLFFYCCPLNDCVSECLQPQIMKTEEQISVGNSLGSQFVKEKKKSMFLSSHYQWFLNQFILDCDAPIPPPPSRLRWNCLASTCSPSWIRNYFDSSSFPMDPQDNDIWIDKLQQWQTQLALFFVIVVQTSHVHQHSGNDDIQLSLCLHL